MLDPYNMLSIIPAQNLGHFVFQIKGELSGTVFCRMPVGAREIFRLKQGTALIDRGEMNVWVALL